MQRGATNTSKEMSFLQQDGGNIYAREVIRGFFRKEDQYMQGK